MPALVDVAAQRCAAGIVAARRRGNGVLAGFFLYSKIIFKGGCLRGLTLYMYFQDRFTELHGF
jgi:hypothetical protein